MSVTANSIITPQAPKSGYANVASANTTYSTSATATALITAGANGARVTKIQAIPCETVTASFLQVYRATGAAPATKYLALAQTCGSDTVSATDGPTVIDFGLSDDNPMLLAAGEIVSVATAVAKSFNFIAEWADY